MGHHRTSERIQISGMVRIFWEDERGVQHFCRAEARDVSDTGLSVTPYTSNEKTKGRFASARAEMQYFLYTLGVDALFTDNPDQFPRQ